MPGAQLTVGLWDSVIEAGLKGSCEGIGAGSLSSSDSVLDCRGLASGLLRGQPMACSLPSSHTATPGKL